MTWGEFKTAIEQLGVTDDEKLWFIDWHDGNVPELFDSEERKRLGVSIT